MSGRLPAGLQATWECGDGAQASPARLTQSDLTRISVVNEQMVWIAGRSILLGTATGGD